MKNLLLFILSALLFSCLENKKVEKDPNTFVEISLDSLKKVVGKDGEIIYLAKAPLDKNYCYQYKVTEIPLNKNIFVYENDTVIHSGPKKRIKVYRKLIYLGN